MGNTVNYTILYSFFLPIYYGLCSYIPGGYLLTCFVAFYHCSLPGPEFVHWHNQRRSFDCVPYGFLKSSQHHKCVCGFKRQGMISFRRSSHLLDGGFKYIQKFTPTWGNDSIWMCFKGVETTKLVLWSGGLIPGLELDCDIITRRCRNLSFNKANLSNQCRVISWFPILTSSLTHSSKTTRQKEMKRGNWSSMAGSKVPLTGNHIGPRIYSGLDISTTYTETSCFSHRQIWVYDGLLHVIAFFKERKYASSNNKVWHWRERNTPLLYK